MKDTENKESLFKQMYVTQTKGFIDISKKRDFWMELAKELNGVFTVKHTIAKDQELLFLKIPYNNITIEFTESDSHPLKINCLIDTKQKLEFSLSYEDSIEKLFKFFGAQDIIIDDAEFDKKYLIQGNSPDTIKEIFSMSELRNIILKNNVFSLVCTYQEKEEKISISCIISRTVFSKSELHELYNLFCITTDKLKELKYI